MVTITYLVNKTLYNYYYFIIPAHFFRDISVGFISWECWDFWRRHDHFLRFSKKSEVFWSLRMCINASSLQVLFTSKIRDREEGIVIYSFYTWFSFLIWVWVNIFLDLVSSKTHIFQSGVRNWLASVSRREIKVFNPQAWDSRLRRVSWQVYNLWLLLVNNQYTRQGLLHNVVGVFQVAIQGMNFIICLKHS